MIKIRVWSDLHLEISNFEPINEPEADVLILSGDICTSHVFNRSDTSPYIKYKTEFYNFFEKCSKLYKHVLYVSGNHESYGNFINKTDIILKENLTFDNVHYLNEDFIEIDGIKFIGCTLWTDLNKGCPITKYQVKSQMNDYRYIQINDNDIYRKLVPYDTFKIHKSNLEYIKREIESSEKVVVITHHAPSDLSIHEKYKKDVIINGAYKSNLEDIMLNNPQIKLWTHGHMHDSFDYTINETRVICNPKGYFDENESFNKHLIVEI